MTISTSNKHGVVYTEISKRAGRKQIRMITVQRRDIVRIYLVPISSLSADKTLPSLSQRLIVLGASDGLELNSAVANWDQCHSPSIHHLDY
ncbi:hypothetical protein J6590_050184 [Homalodisca vitripennis]|nr:hypothetical protein J6590_050184 [Homalodisca vitripennis]